MIVIGAMDERVVTALVVAGLLAVFGVLLVITAAGELRGRRIARVPAGFRPGPSDEELERATLPKVLMWSAIAALFMAVWLPVYWIREPTRLAEARERLRERDLYEDTSGNTGGERLYLDFCARCHGTEGEGTLTPFTVDGKQAQYPEPPLKYIYARYKAAGRSEDEITQLIYDAINRGRPGTPMPTWGIAFGGPFISHQVDILVEYLKEIQEPIEENSPQFRIPNGDETDGEAIYQANCAACHGPKGEGIIGPNLQVTLARLSREEVAETLRRGRINMNRPSMPAWAPLGDEAIEALVRFIESIQVVE